MIGEVGKTKFRRILDNISPERRLEIDKDIIGYMAFNRWLAETDQEYGTPTSYSLKLLNEKGFYPIGITYYFGEETFIFKTSKESSKAFDKCEKELSTVIGWYYSLAAWNKLKQDEYKQEPYWL